MKAVGLILLGIAAGILAGFIYLAQVRQSDTLSQPPYLQIGRYQISLEIADEPAERRQGLAGRESLADNAGMLFVFPVEGRYSFTMTGMLFPLDFVWLDESLKIVQVNENQPNPPAGERGVVIEPRTPVRYVLELPAGMIERLGLEIGKSVKLVE